MYVVDLPIFTMASKKKRFYLNLNGYRNAHHRVLDKAKKDFHEICQTLLRDIPHLPHTHIVYTFFAPSNQRSDTANICSIVDKFFSDSLVKCGILTDDNRDVVLSVHYRFGGVEPTNPRVEASLVTAAERDALIQDQPIENPLDLTKEETERPLMKITIVETEIQAAIRAFIGTQIQIQPGQVIDMEIRATRGEEGFIANIDIHAEGTPSAFAKEDDKPLGITRAVETAKAAPAPVTSPKTTTTAVKAAATKPTLVAPPAPEPTPEPVFTPEAGIDERQREEEPPFVEDVVELVEAGPVEVVEIVETVAVQPEPVENIDRGLGVDGGEPLNKKPSIFAGLGNPKNAPKATEAAEA